MMIIGGSWRVFESYRNLYDISLEINREGILEQSTPCINVLTFPGL